MTKTGDGKVAVYMHVVAGYDPVSIINVSKHESSCGEAENSITRKNNSKKNLKNIVTFHFAVDLPKIKLGRGVGCMLYNFIITI